MIVTTKELFQQAYGKYAIGAYNINNLEQTMGLFKGNVDSKAPFIVQLSKGARTYTHKLMLETMMTTADKIFPDAIFAVHLDHGDEETCMDCINSGVYSSVMIDASHEPLEKNIEITKRVVDAAHAKGIVVEAELGQLKGIEEDVHAADLDHDHHVVRAAERLAAVGRGRDRGLDAVVADHALDEAVHSGRIQRGDLILLVVFGAGLTWGAAIIEW